MPDSESSNSLKNIQLFVSLIYILFILFTTLHFIIPYTHESGSLLDVRESLDMSNDQINKEYVLLSPLNIIYILGHYTCHQINDRSFFINGNQMPVCSRCLGIYIGMTLIFFVAIVRRPTGTFFKSLCRLVISSGQSKSMKCTTITIIILGVLLSIPMATDVSLQIFTPYLSNNITRFVTGFLFGIFEGGCVIGIISHIVFVLTNRNT